MNIPATIYESRGPCKCRECNGTCQDEFTICNGEIIPHICDDYNNCVCCVPSRVPPPPEPEPECEQTRKCRAHNGTCQSAFGSSTTLCNGRIIPRACDKDSDCICCVPDRPPEPEPECPQNSKCRRFNGVCQDEWSICNGEIIPKACDKDTGCVCCAPERPPEPEPECPLTHKCRECDGICQDEFTFCTGEIVPHICDDRKGCVCCVPPRLECTQSDECRICGGQCQDEQTECNGTKVIHACDGKDCVCCIPPSDCEQSRVCTGAGGLCQDENAECPGFSFNDKCAGAGCTCCIPRIPPTPPSEFCTYTRGGWRSPCDDVEQQQCPASVQWGNPNALVGCLRDCLVDNFFDNSMFIIGNSSTTAYSNFTATNNQTLAESMVNYLNNENGPPGKYDSVITNPLSTTANNFGAQLMVANTNIEFSFVHNPIGTSELRFDTSISNCSQLVLSSCFDGMRIQDMIDYAHEIISCTVTPNDICENSTISDWNIALTLYNEEYVGCSNGTTGCIVTNHTDCVEFIKNRGFEINGTSFGTAINTPDDIINHFGWTIANPSICPATGDNVCNGGIYQPITPPGQYTNLIEGDYVAFSNGAYLLQYITNIYGNDTVSSLGNINDTCTLNVWVGSRADIDSTFSLDHSVEFEVKLIDDTTGVLIDSGLINLETFDNDTLDNWTLFSANYIINGSEIGPYRVSLRATKNQVNFDAISLKCC